MTQTIARIKKAGKHFEIMVDMDLALAFRKGSGGNNFLELEKVFTDAKKGDVPPQGELENAFGTTEIQKIAEEIVKHGEVLVNQEHREAEQDKKVAQVVDYLVVNAIDPKTGNPHTPERIKSALHDGHVNIKNVPVEDQIQEILSQISPILPIKVQTKKIKVTIPAQFTGQAYRVVKTYKEKEDWKNDGSLEVVMNVPAGVLMDFYDKINSVTHGSAIAEEIGE